MIKGLINVLLAWSTQEKDSCKSSRMNGKVLFVRLLSIGVFVLFCPEDFCIQAPEIHTSKNAVRIMYTTDFWLQKGLIYDIVRLVYHALINISQNIQNTLRRKYI